MSKITLNNVGSPADNTMVNTINGNNQTLQTAFDNTLSRDGTSPNQMGANIDMNSNRVINLPSPISGTEPLRLQDLTPGVYNPSFTLIPMGGATGQVLAKTANTDYAVAWTQAATGIPTGGTTGQVLTKNSNTNYDASWTTVTGGTVTSVALTVPSILAISGSPITTSGTLALSLATQSANTVFAGPTSGGAAAPTFRALVAADFPSLSVTVPYANAVSRTVASTFGDWVSVTDFGADPTGTADSTTAFNNALLASGAVFVPPGTWKLSSGVNIPSNRFFWVQKGATVTNTGGRFTSYVPGGGNIEMRIDGIMYFPATATAPSQGGTAGWDYNLLWNNRGIIELGGSVASPASQIWIYGVGEVYSDYVWPGSPPSSFTNLNSQMNRKGICLFNAGDSCIEGLNVHNIYGEAVYAQPGASGYTNVRFLRNHVHEVAFNGLNFNVIGVGYNFVMRDNYVQNCWQGIESSTGNIDGNYVLNATSGMITGAGQGGAPLRITNNIFHTCNTGLNVAFSATYEDVVVQGNQIHNPNTGGGIILNNISSVSVLNNMVYNGNLITNPFVLNSSFDRALVANNIIRGGSTNVTNNGTNVTLANNILL